jgi:flagellar basal-body rod protein FlgG
MDVIANNLANVETRGFRSDNLVTQSFKEMLISRVSDPNMYVSERAGDHNTGIHVDRVYTSFDQGALENTGIATDFAIAGDAFFAIETEAGERYTRAGSFTLDATGYLVTPQGQYVLGEAGRVFAGSPDFSVAADGTVSAASGRAQNKLRIVSFPDNGALRKGGDNLFFNLNPGANAPAASTAEIKQGFLENSNVDTAREMVDMLNVYRSYEINQRIARMVDESMGKAVNDIARV